MNQLPLPMTLSEAASNVTYSRPLVPPAISDASALCQFTNSLIAIVVSSNIYSISERPHPIHPNIFSVWGGHRVEAEREPGGKSGGFLREEVNLVGGGQEGSPRATRWSQTSAHRRPVAFHSAGPFLSGNKAVISHHENIYGAM